MEIMRKKRMVALEELIVIKCRIEDLRARLLERAPELDEEIMLDSVLKLIRDVTDYVKNLKEED